MSSFKNDLLKAEEEGALGISGNRFEFRSSDCAAVSFVLTSIRQLKLV